MVFHGFHRFHDALAWTLRHSIRSELQTIEQTLVRGKEKLSKLPESMDEVAEANHAQLTLAKNAKQIRTQMDTIEDKEQLLRQGKHIWMEYPLGLGIFEI